jgi:FAD binding domain
LSTKLQTFDPTRPSPDSAVDVLAPGDGGWDLERAAWNLATDQHPTVIALPRSVAEVSAAVRSASRAGLRVTAQATGHGAGAYETLEDAILIKTRCLRGVEINPPLVARASRRERCGWKRCKPPPSTISPRWLGHPATSASSATPPAIGLFRSMGRSRRVARGPEIASCGVDLLAEGAQRPVLGVRERRRVAASFAAGCRLGLGSGVGVVDPGAKRRFWD